MYVSDIDSGWWNIHRVTLKFFDSLHDFDTIQISHSPMLIAPGYEFCKPQWNLGTKYFDFITTTAGCKLVSIWHDTNHSMFAVTCDPHQSHTLPLTSDQETDIQVIPVPPVLLQTQQIQLTTCNSLQVAFDSTIILLSGSATLPLAIYSWNLHHPDNITLIQCSVPLESVELIPSSFLSIPQHVTFPTYSDPLSGADNVAYGWYYPPTHPIYAPAGNSNSTILPPLLVKCHGGPTGSTSIEYRLDIQYFTSRGIAVLDVDYTGSTGYGREYRQRLYRQWGVHDRKDCIHGVKYLITKGLVDEKRVAIDGSSAGGYTTLAAITIDEEKVFTAASSSYGYLLISSRVMFSRHW